MGGNADWLDLAVQVEDIVLRVLAELKPGRVLKTNVEYYAAAVLQGVGLTPDLFPATFALARHAGWTAHAIEQVERDQAHPAGHALHRSRGARPAGLRPRPGSTRCLPSRDSIVPPLERRRAPAASSPRMRSAGAPGRRRARRR